MDDVKITATDTRDAAAAWPNAGTAGLDSDAIGRAIGETILIATKAMLTVEEAARYTGLKVNYIYKLLQNRAFPYFKPGGSKVFIARVDIENWMRTGRIMSRNETEIQAERLYHKRNLNANRTANGTAMPPT